MNQIEVPQPETNATEDIASENWAREVADYLSGADNRLASELDDRPASRVTEN